ncbi:MAG: hypothetical protein ABIJ34_04795 [archaeon]
MPPPPMHPILFISEPIYTVIALAFCIIIYLKTKESYELTKYQGIKYFRYAFLFFGLSYLARFLFNLAFFSTFAFDIFIPRRIFMPFLILILGYLSTVAISNLIISAIWKGFRRYPLFMISQVLGIIVAVTGFLTNSHLMLLYMQSGLLVIALILGFFAHKKKTHHTQALYMLIFLLWLINLWIIERMRMLFFVEVFFEIVSIIVFVIIYHRISKWIK